jgi:transcription antitermination factor NusG
MRPTEAGDDAKWFCVHTKPKCEHIAAAHLGDLGVEAFCPRIRYQKTTRRGRIWFLEALFPSYMFARFTLAESLRAVNYAQAVVRVVKFGEDDYSVIPDPVIDALRKEMGDGPYKVIETQPNVGDEVVIAEGPLLGYTGIVMSRLSGKDRVQVLLEFLGKQQLVDAKVQRLNRQGNPRDSFQNAG